MKNFKKSIACAVIVTSFVLANGTDTQKAESKEIQPAVTQENNDQNKQIVPVAPAIPTEQNQIVKIENQKKEEKVEPKEIVLPNLIEKLSFEELLKAPRTNRIMRLNGGLNLLLNNSLDQYKADSDWTKVLANWIKDEWTKKENKKFSKEEIDTLLSLIDNSVVYLKNIQNNSNFKTIIDLIWLDDIYKPFFIKKLFPELESELKDIKLNERSFSYSESKKNYKYSFSSYSYTYIPEEKCQKFAADMAKQFKTLPADKQFVILAAWLTNEWTPILSK